MKSLAIIVINALAHFAVCIAGFLITSFLTGSDPTQKDFLSLRPLTLAAVVSLPLATLHGLVIGGAIAYWREKLTDKPLAGALILAVFANLLTIFWLMFLFLKLGEDSTPVATARGAGIAIVMMVISLAANLVTIHVARKMSNGGTLK
jgi:hypothetical protein